MAKGASCIAVPHEVAEHDARLYLAMKLYELGKMSLGSAAEYAGYSVRAFIHEETTAFRRWKQSVSEWIKTTGFSRWSFIEILGKHHVPIFNYAADELPNDIENADPDYI